MPHFIKKSNKPESEFSPTGSALSFGRTWPDKNSQIPDVVCTLLKKIFG